MSSQPIILVQAGPSLSKLVKVPVNSAPVDVSSDLFKGSVGVRLDNYRGPHDDQPATPDTAFHDRATFSIVINGTFLEEGLTADEIMWGNEWDKPLRDSLPYGTSAALKFANVVDPTLRHDIYADKPWALSPLLSTVNYLSITKLPSGDKETPFDWEVPEDVTAVAGDSASVGHPDQRKKWLSENMSKVHLGRDVLIKSDFCNGYVDFKTLSLKLPIGLHFSLRNIWDGQPVRFVCRTQEGDKRFFVVTFQIVEEGGADAEAEETHSKHDKEEEVGEDKDLLGID
ncbi:DUF1769-domain-containing protein [Meredithblackwellia eburnea MCA 4105]